MVALGKLSNSVFADQAPEYAKIWAEFAHLRRTAAHRLEWAAWSTGYRRHRLLVALVVQPGVVRDIESVQRGLVPLCGLELHPPRFFHISVQSIGFDDQLELDVERLGAAIGLVPPFDVRLGGVNAFRSAVFMEVHSAGRLLNLRKAIRQGLGGPDSLMKVDPFDGLLFHLTLGYFGAESDSDALRAAIRPLRRLATARMRIDQIALVELATDQAEPYPRLYGVHSFSLHTRS